MMYLFRNITILDPTSSHHLQQKDVLVEDGIIIKIATLIEADKNTIIHDFSDCYLSVGFCDLITQSGEPGNEHHDTLQHLSEAASVGGYTAACVLANNKPITQNKTHVDYFKNNANSFPIDIYPIAALTQNFDGKTPTEMLDLHNAGAIAFSDIPNTIQHADVLLRALQYTQQFSGVVFALPYNKDLVVDAQIHESSIAVRMGMKGISEVPEFTTVHRDIELLRYAGGKLHLAGITTPKSLELIAQAKQEGLAITCSVFVHHLLATEEEVLHYNQNAKVFPPLRNETNRQALINAVKNGVVDVITTQHTPLDVEAKNLEFEYADFGMIGLETALPLLLKHTDIPLEQLIAALSTNPRKIINQNYSIEEHSKANFTIFSTHEQGTICIEDIKSKSKNTPFIGKTKKGKIRAIFNKSTLVIHG